MGQLVKLGQVTLFGAVLCFSYYLCLGLTFIFPSNLSNTLLPFLSVDAEPIRMSRPISSFPKLMDVSWDEVKSPDV